VTIQAQIEALESLTAIDNELRGLTEELDRERANLDTKKQKLAELDERLVRDRNSIGDMERMRGELLAEVRQMGNQVEKAREKLGRCRTEREANAAQREVEELRKLQRDREIEVEKLVGLLDQAKVEIQKTQGERDEIAQELGACEGDVTTRLAELSREQAQRNELRKGIVAKVTPQLYRRYELVRKRRGTGISHTFQGTCSACHMVLPPMLFQQLARGTEFGQCPSCSRILYIRPEATETDEQTGTP
jgi:hypothetical protein